jgi:hypothetical protein
MRTKTLLLTAALAAAGLVTLQAQTTVYSINAVGFVNLTLGEGFTMIANPLNGTNNNLTTIIPTAPDGTQVLTWDAANQRFNDAIQYVEGLGWLADTVLNPGDGAFINMPPGGATITFVGEVPQGSLSNSIPANFSIKSQLVPQTNGLSSTGFPADDGDQILFWNPATQSYFDANQFVEGLGWLAGDPSPKVGESFFVNKTLARTWTRSFSVNP